MGFSDVILLGVDHHYQASGTPHSTVVGRGGEEDHFVPDYFPKGFRWQLPDLRTSEIAYRMARSAFEADGRRVVDATLGGALEVFPKVDFDEVVGRLTRSVRSKTTEVSPQDQPTGQPASEVEAGISRSAATVPAQPLVTIGIVTWNSERYIRNCVEAVRRQSYPHIKLIVMDNGSEDRSVEILRGSVGEEELIYNQSNEGYCRAHNRILDRAEGDYYLPLNPDVEMQTKFVEQLVNSLETRPEFGSANGKFWLPSETDSHPINSTGLFIDRQRHQFLRAHGEIDHGQLETGGEIFGADGAGPLYRQAALNEARIQGEVYDELYFGYHEDVDLAWRIRLLGWKSWYEPSAVAIHDRSFKPGIRRPMPPHLRRLAVRNRYLTILKNEAPETFRRDWWRILSYDVRIFGYVLLFEQTSLPAYPMLLSTLGRVRSWRSMLWTRVRAPAAARMAWFE